MIERDLLRKDRVKALHNVAAALTRFPAALRPAASFSFKNSNPTSHIQDDPHLNRR